MGAAESLAERSRSEVALASRTGAAPGRQRDRAHRRPGRRERAGGARGARLHRGCSGIGSTIRKGSDYQHQGFQQCSKRI